MTRRKRVGKNDADDVPAGQTSQRGRVWSVVGAIALFSVAGGLAAWWWIRPQPEPAPDAPKRSVAKVELPRIPFQDVTNESRLEFVHENGAVGEKLLPETMGGGVGVLDYDSDGDSDLLFVNSQPWPWDDSGGAPPATCKLYANDGDGRFTDVSHAAGLDVSLYGMGCAVGDYDNDGDPDLYLSALGPNRLLRNDGGRFIDVTAAGGVAGPADAWSTSCGWFDYDNDGRLDLLVCNYIVWTREFDAAQNFRLKGGGRAYGRPQNFEGVSPLLFRNTGDGTFEEMGAAAGFDVRDSSRNRPIAKSLGLTFADFDRDRDLDVVVANDTERNFLFENLADGTFREIGVQAGIAFDHEGNTRGAMGVDSAMFDRGREIGVAIGNFTNEMTALYVTPRGAMSFEDEAVVSDLGRQTRLDLTFGVLLADFDLDGRTDYFGANGHLEPDINRVLPSQHYAQSPHLFWNCSTEGEMSFCQLGVEQLGADFLKPIVGRGAACADFDKDGDLDLVIAAAGHSARLLRNDLAAGRRWIRFKLVGSKSNRDAIGATVTVFDDGVPQMQTVMPTCSYLSQRETIVTFGFGKANAGKPIERAEIEWPSGQTTAVESLDPNRLHVIEEP